MSRSISRKPKRRQIFDKVRNAIDLGIFKPGQRLPTAEELVEQYGTSRNTVIRALEDLEAVGVLERIQGSGTYVRAQAQQRIMAFSFISAGGFSEVTAQTIFGLLERHIAGAVRTAFGADLVYQMLNQGEHDIHRHMTESVRYAIERGVAGAFYLPIEGTDAERFSFRSASVPSIGR